MKDKIKDTTSNNDVIIEISNTEAAKQYVYNSGKRHTNKPSKLKFGGMKDKL